MKLKLIIEPPVTLVLRIYRAVQDRIAIPVFNGPSKGIVRRIVTVLDITLHTDPRVIIIKPNVVQAGTTNMYAVKRGAV
ncbi:MAG TPA: hypothetical protein EYQ70_01220 [Marine Group III euryarchaeote]|uniref:Uncharacterized protein n=1 Tax=Marine Group III euryarchaeote TaxID=2173149 RepID=A0A7J4GVS4_9ARCH|nr:hypothetical protein [Marine Group III euryarchaeote]